MSDIRVGDKVTWTGDTDIPPTIGVVKFFDFFYDTDVAGVFFDYGYTSEIAPVPLTELTRVEDETK